MIVLTIDNQKIDHWTKDELWLDWLSGYMCRQAVFSKNSHECVSLVSCDRIKQTILIVPTSVSKNSFSNALELSAEKDLYCSEHTGMSLKEKFSKEVSEYNIQSLKKYISEITTPDIVSYL